MKTTEDRLAALEQTVRLLAEQMIERQREGIHFSSVDATLTTWLVAAFAELRDVPGETIKSRILEDAALAEQSMLEEIEDRDAAAAAILDTLSLEDVPTTERPSPDAGT